MADSIRMVDYFYIDIADRPGEGARALAHLKDSGVNLEVFSGFPAGRRAQLDFVPSDPAAFRAAAKAAKWKVTGPRKAFLLQGEDRPGAIADTVGRLAAAKINITAVDAL